MLAACVHASSIRRRSVLRPRLWPALRSFMRRLTVLSVRACSVLAGRLCCRASERSYCSDQSSERGRRARADCRFVAIRTHCRGLRATARPPPSPGPPSAVNAQIPCVKAVGSRRDAASSLHARGRQGECGPVHASRSSGAHAGVRHAASPAHLCAPEVVGGCGGAPAGRGAVQRGGRRHSTPAARGTVERGAGGARERGGRQLAVAAPV